MSIDVSIIPGRGPFLFDGTVPGMDEVQYECTFVLRNLTDKAEEVQVGFPLDSQFAREPEPVSSKPSARNWVLKYGFIALDEVTTYNVEFVRRKPGKGAGEFGKDVGTSTGKGVAKIGKGVAGIGKKTGEVVTDTGDSKDKTKNQKKPEKPPDK